MSENTLERALVDDMDDLDEPKEKSIHGIKDYWRDGMSQPHATLGWFPLSMKGNAIRYWTLNTPQQFFRYLSCGYYSTSDFGLLVGNLPCRMHICLVCKAIFDAGFQTTVTHCDSQTHCKCLTEILDLETSLPPGLNPNPSVEDILNSFGAMGLDLLNTWNEFQVLPVAAEASCHSAMSVQSTPFSQDTPPHQSMTIESTIAPHRTPSFERTPPADSTDFINADANVEVDNEVDRNLVELLMSSLNIAEANEILYNCLLSRMSSLEIDFTDARL